MSKEIPQLSPEDLLQIFISEGRDGLIKVLCVFEDEPRLNGIMEEMVDCTIAAFTGEMPISSFVTAMDSINRRFYDNITDVALDEFSDGNITSGHLTECLDGLRDKKAKCDVSEKNHT
jgi:hypothetical protein